MSARAHARGMTLMELVIGLAITGIMAAAGVAAFGSIIDHRASDSRASASDRARGGAARDDSIVGRTMGPPRVQIGGGPRGLTRAGRREGAPAPTHSVGMNDRRR